MIVYVSGPYSSENPGEVIRNVEVAMSVAKDLRERGHYPMIPHLFHWYGVYHKRVTGKSPEYESMMDWCIKLLERCDAMVVINNSPGTNREIQMAKEFGKPVYDLRDKTQTVPSAEYQRFHASSREGSQEDQST